LLFSRQYAVLLGAYHFASKSENGTERYIEKKIVHPDFDAIPEAAYNDVAILILEEAVVFSDKIRPICLSESPSVEADHLAGVAASVSGWGVTDVNATDASETLKTAPMAIYLQRY